MRYIKEMQEAWQRRRDRVLYDQWVKHYDLPPQETPADVPKARRGNLYQQWAEDGSLNPEDIPPEATMEPQFQERPANPLQVKQLMNYMIIEGIVIVVLLIALTVTITLLIVK